MHEQGRIEGSLKRIGGILFHEAARHNHHQRYANAHRAPGQGGCVSSDIFFSLGHNIQAVRCGNDPAAGADLCAYRIVHDIHNSGHADACNPGTRDGTYCAYKCVIIVGQHINASGTDRGARAGISLNGHLCNDNGYCAAHGSRTGTGYAGSVGGNEILGVSLDCHLALGIYTAIGCNTCQSTAGEVRDNRHGRYRRRAGARKGRGNVEQIRIAPCCHIHCAAGDHIPTQACFHHVLENQRIAADGHRSRACPGKA